MYLQLQGPKCACIWSLKPRVTLDMSFRCKEIELARSFSVLGQDESHSLSCLNCGGEEGTAVDSDDLASLASL